jgi:hypothetical protein
MDNYRDSRAIVAGVRNGGAWRAEPNAPCHAMTRYRDLLTQRSPHGHGSKASFERSSASMNSERMPAEDAALRAGQHA